MTDPNDAGGTNSVREWLREAIARTGMSPSEVARIAGLNPSTVTRFMNSDQVQTMRIDTLRKIARASGHTLPEALAGTSSPPPAQKPSQETRLAVKLADLLPIGRRLTEEDRVRIMKKSFLWYEKQALIDGEWGLVAFAIPRLRHQVAGCFICLAH